MTSYVMFSLVVEVVSSIVDRCSVSMMIVVVVVLVAKEFLMY